ncbi:hypothetical protein EVAR_60711_1 [Eumeta japonica]|uniref:Uncharacterized protein n=1 Tax=Eumeta variegata TaxID=151549 RepID=A0A4C1ZB07_EUMVA|nr:hypothetical protein EVAR_60711_1 [Eumeta japonica]
MFPTQLVDDGCRQLRQETVGIVERERTPSDVQNVSPRMSCAGAAPYRSRVLGVHDPRLDRSRRPEVDGPARRR